VTQDPHDQWNATRLVPPPENTRVDWLQANGAVVYGGTVKGKAWYTGVGTMVFYVPQYWRVAVK